MALEIAAGALLGWIGLGFFMLAALDAVRLYRITNSLVWFSAGAAAGLGAAASVFWVVHMLAPHIAVLAMVLALLVQLSAFTFVALYMAKKRLMEQTPI